MRPTLTCWPPAFPSVFVPFSMYGAAATLVGGLKTRGCRVKRGGGGLAVADFEARAGYIWATTGRSFSRVISQLVGVIEEVVDNSGGRVPLLSTGE